jgi:hypothetical protein
MQEVVGGQVRAYFFNHVAGRDISQGYMMIDFGDGFVKHPVTVVILGQEQEHGIAGARIVAETSKISGFSDWVQAAYFSTFCTNIDQHIVVYEQFVEHFNFDHPEGLPFFQDEYQLTPIWTTRLRYRIVHVFGHACMHAVRLRI